MHRFRSDRFRLLLLFSNIIIVNNYKKVCRVAPTENGPFAEC